MILVEPRYSGNIGLVARCMKNFGIKDLYLVKPCAIDDDARRRAVHAQEIVDNARIFDSFEEALKEIDYAVATSSITVENEKAFLRKAISLREFVNEIKDFKGKVGLIFGREDYGLFNHEIAECDALVTIPTSERYRSLSLSHAVAIFLYEIFASGYSEERKERNIGYTEKKTMYRYFEEILDLIEYPSHKLERMKVVFRRVMGRAKLTIWEYHTLMGVMSEIVRRLKSR